MKLIQQVYKKIGGFDNKSKEHSYPVHEKVAGQFSSKGTDPLGHRWGILADFWVSHEIGSGNFQHMLDLWFSVRFQNLSSIRKLWFSLFYKGDQREKFKKKTMDSLGRDFEFFCFGPPHETMKIKVF